MDEFTPNGFLNQKIIIGSVGNLDKYERSNFEKIRIANRI